MPHTPDFNLDMGSTQHRGLIIWTTFRYSTAHSARLTWRRCTLRTRASPNPPGIIPVSAPASGPSPALRYTFEGDERDSPGVTLTDVTVNSTGAKEGSKCGQFDGSKSHMTFPFAPTTSVFTISMWVNHNNNTVTQTYLSIGSKIRTNAGTSGLYVENPYAGGSTGTIKMGDNWLSGMSINTWYHFVFVADTGSVYRDGVLAGSVGSGDYSTNSHNLTIGFHNESGGYTYFNGLIDDIQIFNSTLSDDDVAALYASYTGVPESPASSRPAVLPGCWGTR